MSYLENKTFKFGANTNFNSCVGKNGINDIFTYESGYENATNILIQYIKNDQGLIDILVYPIIYSARHKIELFLKSQLLALLHIKKQVKNITDDKIKLTHDLKILWNQLKDLTDIDERYNHLITELDEYITDYYDIDLSGETFRYPYSIDNIQHLTNFTCINIEEFEKRFLELTEICDEIRYLTDFLISEYEQKTIINNLSRPQIEQIAIKLPQYNAWENDDFKKIKQNIMNEYEISSNTFSKIINLIKKHKLFSQYIGIENPIYELKIIELKKYINHYKKYQIYLNQNSYSSEKKIEVTKKICEDLSDISIKALSVLYQIGFHDRYCEEYEALLKLRKDETPFDIIYYKLLDKGIILEKIKKGLENMGQKSLIHAIENHSIACCI